MSESALAFDTAILSSQGGREANQDEARHFPSPDGGCWILCDGLGGYGGGETAARIGVTSVLQSFALQAECSESALRMYLESARQAILAERAGNPQLSAMDSTVVVLLASGGRALWAHAGDSRLYWFRAGRLETQTRDHSLPQALVGAGKISPREIRFHEDRNKVLRTLAGGETLRADLSGEAIHLKSGDAFLLASDGLWELVDETEMEVELARSTSAEAWLKGLETCLRPRAFSGHDNYSAIAVRVNE
jgi:PPM family protein phosphatase